MLFNIRRVMRASPLLFTATKRITRSYDEVIFPDKQANVFVTSWGRSGNTFAAALTKELWPKLAVRSHGHVVALLKISKKNSVPTVVTVRDPREAVASLAVKWVRNAKLFKNILTEWIDYHSFLDENSSEFSIVDFNTLTNSPQLFVRELEGFGFPTKSDSEVEHAVKLVLQELRQDDRPFHERNLSNPKKMEEISRVKPQIDSLKSMPLAVEIYERLTQK